VRDVDLEASNSKLTREEDEGYLGTLSLNEALFQHIPAAKFHHSANLCSKLSSNVTPKCWCFKLWILLKIPRIHWAKLSRELEAEGLRSAGLISRNNEIVGGERLCRSYAKADGFSNCDIYTYFHSIAGIKLISRPCCYCSSDSTFLCARQEAPTL
jgi:hypothetical protein